MYTINKDNKKVPIEDVDIDDLYYLLNKYNKMFPITAPIDRWKKKWVTILDNEINIRKRKDKLKKIISNVYR